MSTYSSPIPGVYDYGRAQAAALQAYNNAKARLNNQRGDLLRSYGYMRDASGNVVVDPNNPYGQYQSMMRGQARDQESAEAAQASRGFAGSSGYLGTQLARLRQDQQGQQYGMATQMQSGLTSLQDQEQELDTDYGNKKHELEWGAAQQAIGNREFNPADYEGLNYDPYGDTESAAPNNPGIRPVGRPRPKAKAKPKAVTYLPARQPKPQPKRVVRAVAARLGRR